MPINKRFASVVAAATLLCASNTVLAGPVFDEDGTVEVPAFKLPPSSFSSPEALALARSRAKPHHASPPVKTMEEYRRTHDAALQPFVDKMRALYPTDMVESSMAGVRIRIFTPKGKAAAPDKVLINIHGGGFVGCEGACSQLESIPVSAVGGFKVISVLYRMAPENVFPAGVEDVTKVYRELLKRYRPRNIGIFGCSAGGQLTAETAAWLASHSLPRPGAIGVFGAGPGAVKGGDSDNLAPAIDGGSPPAKMGADADPSTARSYFDGTDVRGPLASPVLHPDVLAKFPPTLIITSTRAADFSQAIFGHSQLVNQGVPGDLLVADGLGHCYQYVGDLPESRDAYQATVRFFDTYLGH